MKIGDIVRKKNPFNPNEDCFNLGELHVYQRLGIVISGEDGLANVLWGLDDIYQTPSHTLEVVSGGG